MALVCAHDLAVLWWLRYSSIFVRYTLRIAPVTSRLARSPMRIEMTLGDGPLVILHKAAGWKHCR